MADIDSSAPRYDGVIRKFKDSGDGTYREVVALAEGSLPSGASPIRGASPSVAAGLTRYTEIDANGTVSPTGSDPTDLSNAVVQRAFVSSVAGTLSDLLSFANTAPGAGESYVLTVYKNGAATDITVTYGPADTAKNDTTHTAAVAVGDRLAMEMVISGGAAGSEFSRGMKFTPS